MRHLPQAASNPWNKVSARRRLTLEKVRQLGAPLGGSQPADKGYRKAAKELGLSKDTVARAELTVTEKSEQIAEWVRLTGEKQSQNPAQLGQGLSPKAGHQRQQGGMSAAVRELGITRQEGQRAVKIAGLSPEAKQAARETGRDNNQSVLLKAAQPLGGIIHRRPLIQGPPAMKSSARSASHTAPPT